MAAEGLPTPCSILGGPPRASGGRISSAITGIPFRKPVPDEGTVICLHIGSSKCAMAVVDPGVPIDCTLTMTPLSAMEAATDLL